MKDLHKAFALAVAATVIAAFAAPAGALPTMPGILNHGFMAWLLSLFGA